MTYLRTPAAIYERSFAAIRAETDLSGFPADIEEVVVRMVHACGMPDIARDVRWGGDVISRMRSGLVETGRVYCDCEAVRAGISRRSLPPGVELVVTLNDPAVPALAARKGTTRSAAAVDLWGSLRNAVVVIGNAPTALFRLLEVLAGGAPRPAAIIATPVGFVGAAESKALLAEDSYGVPFLTLLGRRGGSAIAAAAFNAVSARAGAE